MEHISPRPTGVGENNSLDLPVLKQVCLQEWYNHQRVYSQMDWYQFFEVKSLDRKFSDIRIEVAGCADFSWV